MAAAQVVSSPKLDKVLASLQENANTYTSSGRITVCQGLQKLEAQPDVWGVRYSDFRSLVEDNRLMAWKVYEAWKTATDVFNMRTIEATGFWAALRLGAIEKESVRNMVAREIRRWQVTQGLFTSYQAVDVWLRAKYPDLFPPGERNSLIEKLRKENASLSRAYVRVVAENQRLKLELKEARRGH